MIEPAATSGGGGGGGVDTRDLLGQRSDRAFSRAFEDAQRRAVTEAINAADFSLAKEEAQALHQLRTTAAKALETDGEQYLAQQQADHSLQDTLRQISNAETKLLEDIRRADEEAAKELLNARRELEAINARQQAQANADIAGAQAFLIAGSQFGDQYTAALNDIKVEFASLRAGAWRLPESQRAQQLAQIDAAEQARIDQTTQQFLSQPLTTPQPIGESARGVAATQTGRTIIVNVSVGGHVRADRELADFIEDTVRTADQTGVLSRG